MKAADLKKHRSALPDNDGGTFQNERKPDEGADAQVRNPKSKIANPKSGRGPDLGVALTVASNTESRLRRLI